MTVVQVGLVDTTGTIDAEVMQSVAAALNIQVTRDLPQYWPVNATVRYLPNRKKIPAGVWPVKLVKSLPPGEGGFHLDKHNQPYAEVIASPNDDSWSIDASHETLEMLVDPSGNRMHSSHAIGISGNTVEDTTGQFNYLVEACDPCEANQYGYEIQGVLVSDFITPRFYDPMAVSGTRYSFTGALTRPREILPGGYISFINQESDEWEQILFLGSTPELKALGPASGDKRSLRMWIDGEMERGHGEALNRFIRHTEPNRAKLLEDRRRRLEEVAMVRAKHYDAR